MTPAFSPPGTARLCVVTSVSLEYVATTRALSLWLRLVESPAESFLSRGALPACARLTRVLPTVLQLGNISALDIALFPLLYLISACVLLYVRLAVGFLVSLPTSELAAELPFAQPIMQMLSTVVSEMFVSSDGSEAVRVDTTSTLLMCLILLNTSALRAPRR